LAQKWSFIYSLTKINSPADGVYEVIFLLATESLYQLCTQNYQALKAVDKSQAFF